MVVDLLKHCNNSALPWEVQILLTLGKSFNLCGLMSGSVKTNNSVTLARDQRILGELIKGLQCLR